MAHNGSPIFLFIVLSSVLFTSAYGKTLCPRIFFQNFDESKMLYKFIEGVFVKQSSNHNGFPVYKRENDNLIFYLQTGPNLQPTLVFGLNFNNYFGVAARLLSYASSTVWLSSGTLNRDDVFQGLISYWIYWDSRDRTNYKVNTPPTIKAICVDEDFRECNSDRLYLNSDFHDGKGNILNSANTDYFERLAATFENLRPVYKHSSQNWYLQYTSDNYWLITSTRFPSSSNDGGTYMKVSDFALRPEYITKTWLVHYNGWHQMPSLGIKCRGIRSQANICSTDPCSDGATCLFTSGNETLCVCRPGYYGRRCEYNKKCPAAPQWNSVTEFGYAYPGTLPGYVAMTFCRDSYPSVRYAICYDYAGSAPSWYKQGRACSAPLTTAPPPPTTRPPPPPPRPKPTPKPINFNDYPKVTPAVLSVAISLQILLPVVLWCCACCTKICKEVDEEQDDQRRLDQFNRERETRLQHVQRAQSQEELDQGVQNYRQAEQDFQRETEETQLKRKKGVYRNASFFRLVSMHCYFSFFLWLIYYTGCSATECTKYGDILLYLKIIAIVMMIVCPLVVLIESIVSHELSYIKNIMLDETAWGYIERMQAVAPVISMTVECYHWETRTRVVYYTDANGNTQSRTETYQERVVTFVDTDHFNYGCWVDVSKREMPAISHVALTRVKIDDHVLFGDQETEEDFDQQRLDMLERNRHRDLFMDFSFDKYIPGLEKRISAYVDLSVKPWWIGKCYYWLATLLMLTWPYRWLFRAKTSKSYYDLKKKMYKSSTPPAEVDIMDPIAILGLQQARVAPLADSTINPAFSMSEIPSPELPAGQPSGAVLPPYPGMYGPLNSTAGPPANQGPVYPPTNQDPVYPPTNQTSVYPPANQEIAYSPNAQQVVPIGPPPSYDEAIGPQPQHFHS